MLTEKKRHFKVPRRSTAWMFVFESVCFMFWNNITSLFPQSFQHNTPLSPVSAACYTHTHTHLSKHDHTHTKLSNQPATDGARWFARSPSRCGVASPLRAQLVRSPQPKTWRTMKTGRGRSSSSSPTRRNRGSKRRNNWRYLKKTCNDPRLCCLKAGCLWGLEKY